MWHIRIPSAPRWSLLILFKTRRGSGLASLVPQQKTHGSADRSTSFKIMSVTAAAGGAGVDPSPWRVFGMLWTPAQLFRIYTVNGNRHFGITDLPILVFVFYLF